MSTERETRLLSAMEQANGRAVERPDLFAGRGFGLTVYEQGVGSWQTITASFADPEKVYVRVRREDTMQWEGIFLHPDDAIAFAHAILKGVLETVEPAGGSRG